MSPLLVVLLPVLIIQVLSDFQMTITYGAPDTFTASQTFLLTWERCVAECLANSTCLVIYQVDDEKCQAFTVGQIFAARRLPSGNRLGVKTWSNSNCPTNIEGFEQSGYGYTDDHFQSYTATFNDPLWSFNSSTPLTCPSNFTMFIRPLGPWCIRVIDADGCINKSASAQMCCSNYGGVISGLETLEEQDFVIKEAIAISATSPVNYIYGFWVDGSRREDCPVSSTCKGTNEFTFTDPTLSSDPQGYIWGEGQPDGMKAPANCIVARIRNHVSIGLDDCDCDIPLGTVTCVRGYVCGLKPN